MHIFTYIYVNAQYRVKTYGLGTTGYVNKNNTRYAYKEAQLHIILCKYILRQNLQVVIANH